MFVNLSERFRKEPNDTSGNWLFHLVPPEGGNDCCYETEGQVKILSGLRRDAVISTKVFLARFAYAYQQTEYRHNSKKTMQDPMSQLAEMEVNGPS